ncbi:type II toxin-antitoxin system RelE/ParE family toxin [Allorhizobium pseudoryzae]|uniref:type II toxin-antitoxin system RelE/ParE family toxin n=1 Tax=Allorhizobium pseudoryzae TaxID=379684 RepID=UPI003D07613E
MKRYVVRLTPDAEADLFNIYRYILEASASETIALGYLDRINAFLASFQTFPERGSVRNEIREGLRIIGFERSASIAFLVEAESVIILRIGCRGQSLDL